VVPELKHLGDIRFILEATLECCAMTVDELLGLHPGSVIRTRSAAGDNVDVRVGGELIGQGEIIVVENRLAVRLSDLRHG
jgi:flagellar motor switch protein FliN/FliY